MIVQIDGDGLVGCGVERSGTFVEVQDLDDCGSARKP
jgi:hypothetical protein